ncbi:hypothetical protein EUTSA_v100293320mg, partial [Eutrema salsugineum]
MGSSSIDFINYMPDEILHHILSFHPIDLAIRTSVLSRRWRHVWCKTPCIDFANVFLTVTARKINQTLSSYRAPKIMSVNLHTTEYYVCASDIESWVEFAMFRNVEKLSMTFRGPHAYRFLDGFYLSWKSPRKLTLSSCYLHDESIAKILSGCPILETLRLLWFRGLLEPLDLSRSPTEDRRLIEIVAPHIHNLILSTKAPCTLVDVSSSSKANFDIDIINDHDFSLNAAFIQIMVLKMLAKLQN